MGGEQNTDSILSVVREYVDKENVEQIIIASTTGTTGAKFAQAFKDKKVVVVTHSHGLHEAGKIELKDENKKTMVENGAKLFTGTLALSGPEKAIYDKFGTQGPLDLMANTLRLFCQGTKVCVEITLMATDAGLIAIDKDVIAVAGTGRGADTALLIKPANSSRCFDLKIKEIIAKPIIDRPIEKPRI